MKKAILYAIVFILNIGLYFLLQILGTFVQFFLFGSGESSVKYLTWVSLFFVFAHALILFLLYKKQVLIKKQLFLIVNIAVLCVLFIYFCIYLPAITEY